MLHDRRPKIFLIVDDHPLFLDALCQVLAKHFPQATLITASKSVDALKILQSNAIDIALIDIALHGESGLNLVGSIADQYADTAIIVVSASHATATVTQALDLGAMGYVPKTLGTRILVNAIKMVREGNIFLPESLQQHSVPTPVCDDALIPEKVQPKLRQLGLTRRQYEVLVLIATGYSNFGISQALEISESTVKAHIRIIFKATCSKRRTGMVVASKALGLLPQFDF